MTTRGWHGKSCEEPVGTPFYRAFRESTRELLRSAPGRRTQRIAAAPSRRISTPFWQMPTSAWTFFDGSAFRKDLDFTREERDYAEWLTLPNNRQSVSPGMPNATWVFARNARMINKLLIVQRFRKYLRSDTLYHVGAFAGGQGRVCTRGVCPAQGVRRSHPLRGCSRLHPETSGREDEMQHDELTALARARIRSFAVEELRNAGFLPLDGGYFPGHLLPADHHVSRSGPG